MAYVGWSSVANQVNTTTGAALDVNGQVTSSLYFGAGVGGEGATNLMLAPSLNLNFALFGQTTLDPRIDFRRTTNATVTNSAGVIAYAPHNLLTYSEQFDNAAWTKTRTTISANAILAPNETISADKFILDTTAATTHLLASAVTQIVATYTFSIYAKSAELSQIYLNNGATSTGAFFNLANGTTTPDSGITSTIESVGNGWYRCAITYLSTAANVSNRCYLAQAGSITFATADGTSGLYLWGAQLEVGTSPTTYNSTTVKNLLGYSELFDNAAWTKSNSFVQTNLLTYSEAFDNAAWSKSETTVTANIVNAPNGYQTADKLIESTANTAHALSENIALTINNTYTQTYYVKPAGRTKIQLMRGLSGAFPTPPTALVFDLTTGTYSGSLASGWTNPTITAVNDGWFKITITVTATATGSDAVGLYLCDNSGNLTYTGDGTSGIYVWGAQLVQGSDAGTYRRTDAVALPVYYPNHNGVVCAEKLVEVATTGTHNFAAFNGVNGATMTLSIYAKAAERSQIAIQTGANTPPYFDLSTGTILSGTGATIQSVGNGWYRCSVTTTFGASAACRFYVAVNGNVTYTGNNTSGIYIFGAQLSDSASLDPYVLNAAAAPTAAAYYGARFDYDPVTLAPKGLLIEEQRSNLVTYSEDFRNTADAGLTRPWTYNGITLSNNAVISPDGTLDADKIVETAITDYHGTYQSVTTSGVLTYSAYFKAAERNYAILFISSVASGNAIFDLVNGTVNLTTGVRVSSATINPVGNGWYRCSITSPTLASAAYFPVVGSSDGTASYLGDITKGIYVWGAQLEAGAFATSYIPTAASQVTRAADVATIQGSNFYGFYNQNEGSVFANYANIVLNSFPLEISDGSANNRNYVRYLGSPIQHQIFFVTNTTAQAQIYDITAQNVTTAKTAYGYKQDSFAVRSNGGASADANSVDSSGTTAIMNRLNIGSSLSGTSQINGTIKSISYYPQRLSDSVLKGLTA